MASLGRLFRLAAQLPRSPITMLMFCVYTFPSPSVPSTFCIFIGVFASPGYLLWFVTINMVYSGVAGGFSSTYLLRMSYSSTPFFFESIGRVISITCAFHMYTLIVTCPRRVAHTFSFSCMRRQQTLGTSLFTSAISLHFTRPISKVLRYAPWKESAATAIQPYRVVG